MSHIPQVADKVIAAFRMAEHIEPNPAPNDGERATHSRAERLWSGTNTGDDGYDFAETARGLGFRADPRFGDWPIVVECHRTYDPKDDATDSEREFIHMRLTYIEGGVYLAFYALAKDMRADMWTAPDDEDD